jgi:hypothetical protein
MIPYRFLSPAEEEMTEAALYYEEAAQSCDKSAPPNST